MFDYAKWMQDHFSVIVLTGNIDHEFNEYLDREVCLDGIAVSRFNLILKRLSKRNINIISPMMFIHAFSCVLKTKSPVTVLHISELRGLVPLYALLLKKLFTKRVTLIHSAFGMLQHKASFRRRIFDFFFLRPLIRAIDIELVQNAHERSMFADLCMAFGWQDNVSYLLPLHISAKRSSNGGHKDRSLMSALRLKYGLPQNAFICLFLGRFCEAKGILRTIDVFRQFRERSEKEAFLLIIGQDFDYRYELEKYITKSGLSPFVSIIENVHDERFDYYILSDVLLGFPIIFEETMLASVEALSCGTPIVVSREADIPYVLDSSAGYVIDFSIEGAVSSIMDIAGNIEAFEKNAYEISRTNFNEEHLKEQLLSQVILKVST